MHRYMYRHLCSNTHAHTYAYIVQTRFSGWNIHRQNQVDTAVLKWLNGRTSDFKQYILDSRPNLSNESDMTSQKKFPVFDIFGVREKILQTHRLC